MKNIDSIIVLYPGETSSERINKPANYSFSRVLLEIKDLSKPPVYFLNQSNRSERYGSIRFIYFSKINFIKIFIKNIFKKNILVICQLHTYRKYALLLKRVLGAKILVRLGGVYYGKEFLSSPAFDKIINSHLYYLRSVDMVLSTADGTPVDLYMQRVGVKKENYTKWINGFPVIPNAGNYKRQNQIVCISRLSEEKNIDYVIKAFAAAIPKLSQEYKLVIVGEGPEALQLKNLVKALSIEGQIEFAGFSRDIEKYLYNSRLLLTGFANNTVIEGIATNTPTVTVDIGEMKQLYGRFKNVHIVDYPYGGYGKIPEKYLEDLINKTASLIEAVLNNYQEQTEVVNNEEYGWAQRIKKEICLYESLF